MMFVLLTMTVMMTMTIMMMVMVLAASPAAVRLSAAGAQGVLPQGSLLQLHVSVVL